MSADAMATFQCGMPNPWTPWNPRPWPESSVIYSAPHCEHCFCIDVAEDSPLYGIRRGPHLQCCKCSTLMAEKFVKAWFEILKPGAGPQDQTPPHDRVCWICSVELAGRQWVTTVPASR